MIIFTDIKHCNKNKPLIYSENYVDKAQGRKGWKRLDPNHYLENEHTLANSGLFETK